MNKFFYRIYNIEKIEEIKRIPKVKGKLTVILKLTVKT